MLQVARLAPNLLQEARDSVEEFLRSQFNEDGGAKDRSGNSDLYYSVFALEGLLGLQAEIPEDSVRGYLDAFGDGEGLDLVHLACLARCLAALTTQKPSPDRVDGICRRLTLHRTKDGGFAKGEEEDHGTVYDSFLCLGAYQDLGRSLPHPEGVSQCIRSLELNHGSYANEHGRSVSTIPTTCAAATLLRHLDQPVADKTGEWLRKRAHPQGGFIAADGVPMPDLLSTATALHTLSGLKVSFEDIKDNCLDFVDSLWTGKAFCGSWADDVQDSEYTYYALLALGHLSL